MLENNEYDHSIKIILFGNAAGKSSIVDRFVNDTFSENIMYTVGVDFRVKMLTIDNKVIKVQVWDTTGQEHFRSTTTSYCRRADGIMYVFDISCRDSFNSLDKWIKEVNLLSQDRREELIVGNKCDNVERCVTEEEAISYSKDAKTAHNIDD